MLDKNQFKDKLVLITGASRGIGSAFLELFATAGATVIGTATSEVGVKAIDSALKKIGANGRGMVLDLADRAQQQALMAAITSEFGNPQILINNAGITRDNLMLRMKDEQWDDVLATNLSGVFSLTKACLRGMLKAQWGRIINLSSVVATMGNPGQVNYCAAKAGLLGMTKSLAQEVGSRGITVNAIAPGFIETEMTANVPKAQQEDLFARIPVGRFGSASEVAHLALYLASEEAGYIQGQTLHINGGLWMG
jgi:3-oxoacyl-[acyl-carrier protein] reductase